MSTKNQFKQALPAKVLILAALVLMAVAYFSPLWWVSLTGPQYPDSAFPQGIRIHFHMDSVKNGCEFLETTEKVETEKLDCVHEMDAINHFVGMYPIAAGGVVERGFSAFLMSLAGIMLVGFMITSSKLRTSVLAVGFAGLSVWMYLAYFTEGGIKYQTSGYVQSLVTSLGQGSEEEGEEISPIIARLRDALQESGQLNIRAGDLQKDLASKGQIELKEALSKLHSGSGSSSQGKSLKEILAEAESSGEAAGKELNIRILKSAYEADQARRGLPDWEGSSAQVLFWHYEKSLGRWFNDPTVIKPMVATMKVVGSVLFWGLLAAMVFLVVATRKTGGLFYWLLVLGPALVPVFFIIEYAGWLWWFGHNLSDMAAFSLKSFMPTVFGEGKVAQFGTHSYPHIGFGLFSAASVCLILAGLLTRKGFKEEKT